MPIVLATLLALDVSSCRHVEVAAAPRRENRPPSGPVLFVDGSALDRGEGSETQPFRRLEDALEAVATAAENRGSWTTGPSFEIRVAPGLYRGPFAIPRGTTVTGVTTSVLYAEGKEPALELHSGSALVGLSVQGGSVGIQCTGDCRLVRVSLSGQRVAAVEVREGTARIFGAIFIASISAVVGVRVLSPANLLVQRAHFQGPFLRAVEARGTEARPVGILKLDDLRIDAAITGLHVQSARSLHVQHLQMDAGRGPGVFLAKVKAELVDLRIHGHEYGVQLGDQADVHGREWLLTKSDRAGVALARAKLALSDLTVVGAGDFGAVQSLTSELDLSRFWLHDARGTAIVLRAGRARLLSGTVTQTHDADGASGNALEVRGARVWLEGVDFKNIAGAGMLVSEGAQVSAADVILRKVRIAGAHVETEAQLFWLSSETRDIQGPGLVVTDRGEARLDAVHFERTQTPSIWAECVGGARVELGIFQPFDPGDSSLCRGKQARVLQLPLDARGLP